MCEDTKVNAKQCSKDHLFPYFFGPIFVTNGLRGVGKSESVHFVLKSNVSLMIFRCYLLGILDQHFESFGKLFRATIFKTSQTILFFL